MNAIRMPKAAVIGWPVSHSLSPRLHSYWLKHYRLSGSYTAMPVEPQNLEQALNGLHQQGFCGVNLTVPHKELAMAIVTDCDAIARRVGAINTVQVHEDGRLEGFNTDVFGFMQNLIYGGFNATGRPVAILGAGGAARAAIIGLHAMQESEIRLINRTRSRAEALAENLEGDIRVYDWGDAEALQDCSLLVNATALGMVGQPPLAIDLAALPLDATVTDMVYAPLLTDLLRRAQQRGNPIIDGLGMLLHQARPAFSSFFGQDPEVTPALREYVLAKDD
jgi:shikimate dehydrogenase